MTTDAPQTAMKSNPWRGMSIASCAMASRVTLGDQTWRHSNRQAFTFWMVLGGSATGVIWGREVALSPGVLLLVPPGVAVEVRQSAGEGVEVVMIAFTWDRHGRPLRTRRSATSGQLGDAGPGMTVPGLGDLPLWSRTHTYLAVPQRLLSAHHRYGDARVAWLEMDIQVLRCIQRLGEHGAAPDPAGSGRRSRANLAVNYIYANVGKKITLATLARHVGVSVSTLCLEFRKRYGVSPMKFLAEERMSRARSLLESPDFKIQEVARLCGYASMPLFSRTFKAAHAMSPRAYRAKHL